MFAQVHYWIYKLCNPGHNIILAPLCYMLYEFKIGRGGVNTNAFFKLT